MRTTHLTVQVLRADRLVVVAEQDQTNDVGQLTDLELLSTALCDALEAQQNGAVIGPEVDEVTLRRAERRARLADGRREQSAVVLGGAA